MIRSGHGTDVNNRLNTLFDTSNQQRKKSMLAMLLIQVLSKPPSLLLFKDLCRYPPQVRPQLLESVLECLKADR